MMSLARALPGFEYRPELGRFRDYLGAAVRNTIRKRMTRQDRRREVLWTDASDPPDPAVSEDDVWNREWVLHHYRQAMARVRMSFQPRSLEIFQGLLDGESAPAVAERHGATVEAVYKIKQRVHERLKETIARQLHEEEFPELRI